ncbi:unnamed protein product, partial [Discosporangium mesarthrocarpum]
VAATSAVPRTASAGEKVNPALAQSAAGRIRGARKQSDGLEKLIEANAFEEAAVVLEKDPASGLEKAFVDLVVSNVLTSDDKVAVGTIRRYGLAADALIMKGGLAAALRDEDEKEGQRYLKLFKDSLDDVIVICSNNAL